MKFESLGDWCKWLERNFSPDIMIPSLPVIIRLDGNSFHQYTKGLQRPFDENLTQLMIETTKFLVKETNAIIGQTSSDEITLILYAPDRASIYHEGKKQKILSKLTGNCVSFFNEKRKELLPDHNKIANFDCRIYQTPTLEDAAAQLLWRENDATKNSIYTLAWSMFSHGSLQNLNGNQLQDKMMLEKQVNWNDLPVKYKRGTYIRREETTRNFTIEDLKTLPPKHKAHTDPSLVLTRHEIKDVELPILNKVGNLSDFIFNGATPIDREGNLL